MTYDIFGADIGGVLIDRVADGTDTSFFTGRYLETPQVAGAFDALARLHAGHFAGRVHVISKCGTRIEARSREWLAHHRFHEITGISETHLHFCRERKDKAPIAEALGLTHFVDDRLDVLGYLDAVAHRFLFRPNATDAEAAKKLRWHRFRVVSQWPEIEAAIAS